MKKALLLFSGGQDSAICLFHILKQYDYIETIGFDYGQRHNIELETRLTFLKYFKETFPDHADKMGPDHVYDVSVLNKIGKTSLTHDMQIKMLECGLPNTFVPGRNILFFTLAASYGWRNNISDLVGGMCETDYSGYPDCRKDTLESTAKTLSLGLDYPVTIHTPLMFLSKAESWELLYKDAGQKAIDFVIEHSHSCYKGVRDIRHDWGYGCDDCPACTLRKKGYEAFISR